MRLKALLLAVSSLVSGASIFIRAKLEPSNNAILVENITENLAKFNLSLHPIITVSPDFKTDYSKQQQKKLKHQTTKNIYTALQIPETFCDLVATLKAAACAEPPTKVELQLSTRELIDWKNNYDRGKDDDSSTKTSKILIGTPDRLNSTDQCYVFGHELTHEMIAKDNEKECPGVPFREAHYANTNLTSQEKSFAIYDDLESKKVVLAAITKGINKATHMRKSLDKSANLTDRLFKVSSIKIINCLEQEANASNTTLKQTLDKFADEVSIIQNQYEESTKVYELIAVINGLFARFPEAYNYFFHDFHDILLKRIPAIKDCLDIVAPAWQTLKCYQTQAVTNQTLSRAHS
jgi:hypothetical protein